MAEDLNLRILITAQNAASNVLRGLGTDLGTAGGLALGAGIALAGVAVVLGVAASKAGDFQQGLNRLITGAGDATDNMQQMGQAILGVSVDTGVASGDLLKAMYLIISSHQRGAQAIDTLTVASKGAVIEQASVVDVANVVSGVMTNYGTKTYNATQYMNGLITAVQQGKITLQALSTAMGPIDPIAQNLGISFNDMSAAMTTQTNAMIPAARAATGLRFMMLALENPTKKATDAMAKMGLSSIDVANEMKKSLPGALEMIYNAARKAGPEGSVAFNRAFQDMVGGMRSLSTATALTGSHFQDFVKNSELIKASMEKNKTAVIGWNVAQSGFNVQMDRAKAALNAMFIEIGMKLLPVLTKILVAVVPLITIFASWVIKMMDNKTAMAIFVGVLVGLAAVILIAVVPAIISMGIAMLTAEAMGAPIVLIFLAIVAVVAGVIIAIQHWGQIVQWLKNVWDTVSKFIIMIWNHILDFAKTFGIYLIAAILGPAGIILALIITHWSQIKAFLSNTWNNLVALAANFVVRLLIWFINLRTQAISHIQQLIASITTFFTSLPGKAVQWGQNLITGFINGIKNMIGGVANTIGNVVNTVKNFLGFGSPAKEGPGKDADKWAPNLMRMYTLGIQAGTATVKIAASNVASGAQQGLGQSTGRATSPSGAGGSITIGPINIYGPSRQMADQFIDEISKRLRQKGLLFTTSSGGRAT